MPEPSPRPHLFVDISAHGLGHLAQVAPVLNALSCRLENLRMTLRSGLPTATLQARINAGVPSGGEQRLRLRDAMRGASTWRRTARAYRARKPMDPVEHEARLLAGQAADAGAQ
ncbi:MAG: hypothetical protein IPL11_02340 [Candidatus Accumulibacter sp.]|nr:hypothetical protein [Accumulibacter sp.]